MIASPHHSVTPSPHHPIAPSPHHPITPSPDSRRASDIGRRAQLDLVFAYRRGRTVLAHAYAEPPFRVGRLLDTGSIASMVLVCCGPGVFAGDRLEQRVRVERGARVRLVSQSALQIHPGAGRAATASLSVLDSSYHVEDDGRLDCIWDPVIPFAGARLQQRVDLQIAEGGDLFWSDALMSGRAARGEAWRFQSLDHELRASVGGSLQYLERYAVAPQSRPPSLTWSAHRAHYLGTTIVHSENVTASRAEEAQQRIGAIEAVLAGVDCLTPHLLVGRLLARHGPQFASARAVLGNVFDRLALRRP